MRTLFQYLALIALTGAVELAVSPQVKLATGIYEGLAVTHPDSKRVVHKYLSVRYAQKPERFEPPVPVPPSSELQKATKPPPACIQAKKVSTPEDEDCLFLNIYAPEPNGRSDRAVMIFLYGGGFQSGWAGSSTYDGTSFAANQDVVIVVPNYRTNVFGFPGDAPGHPDDHRNLGLLDQRLAFKFVQDHITSFGGDPKKVTLFGQSAGARSADFHVLTMGKNPPFRAVIMESGSGELTPLADHRRAYRNISLESSFVRLTQEVGCPTPHASIQCMRMRQAKELKDKIIEQHLYFGSTFDGNLTTVENPSAVRNAKLAADVPILFGTNGDETITFVVADDDPGHTTLWDYTATVFGNRNIRDAARELYKVGPGGYKTEQDAIAALETDYAYTCLTSREANISSQAGYPTWRYFFNYTSSKMSNWGAYHGAEMPYVFGNLMTGKDGQRIQEEYSLSQMMQKMWADFAKNPSKGPGWAQVGKDEKDVGYFGPDGKLSIVKTADVDRHCNKFRRMYVGRS